MISRRKFTTMASALLCGSFKNMLPSPLLESGVFIHEPTTQDVSRLVNIMIGTGGHGHCYPGATVPFGMVQLSPDTFNKGWDWCSGYNYSDSSIMGFSHTHLSGTGIGDMLDFLIMPGTGPVKTIPGTRENPDEGYRSRFSHEDEKAAPGYYSVTLLDYRIHAELTATERAGLHRYTFPADQTSHFILDLDHGYADGPGVVQWASLKLKGDTILGGKSTLRWAKGREIYFAMKFSRPWDKVEILVDGKPVESTMGEIKSQSIKVVFHFATKDQEKILIKTGISGVNSDQALLNLNKEIPVWDFDGIRTRASELWEKELSRIQVAGGTERQREIFYTALYHSFLAPTIFDDVDGKYRGMDGAVHQLALGERNYSTFSTWDRSI
jgi:predicted alpha-1,2-mannosidase